MENSQAQEYSSNSLMQKGDGLQLMDQLRPQKGMKVLDLGCGTGYLASVLAQRVGPEGKVIGTCTCVGLYRSGLFNFGSYVNLLC